MAKTKTEEDWFLRGGKRPDANNAYGNPDTSDGEPIEDEPGKVCQNCGIENLAENEHCVCCGAALTGGCPTDEYCGADDGKPKTYIVTMSRTRSVQQTAKVRVKAHSEEEALDLVEDRVEYEAEDWAWKDNDDTEEFDDVEAVEAEVAG